MSNKPFLSYAEMAGWIRNNFAHAGIPCGFITGCASRLGIWPGYAPLDGQELERKLFPTIVQMIEDGRLPGTTEELWQNDPFQRGKFVANSSPGKFRLADRNGIQEGSLGALFQRGDGFKSTGEAGLIQADDLRSHSHGLGSTGVASNAHGPLGGGVYANGGYGIKLNNTDTVGGLETRVLNVTDCWVIRLYGTAVELGEVDVLALATSHLQAQRDIEFLLDRPGFGWDQDWIKPAGTRHYNTTYHNTDNQPIFLNLFCGPTSASNVGIAIITNDHRLTGPYSAMVGGYIGISVPIMPGASYRAEQLNGSAPIHTWSELRSRVV